LVNITNIVILGAVVGAFSLAWLTYLLVEQPIRFRTNQRLSLIALGLLLVTSGVVGESIYKFNSLSNPRLRDIGKVFSYDRANLVQINCSDKALQNTELNYCSFTRTKAIDAILIGDSHADDKFYGFSKVDQERNWMLIGNSSCPPVLGISVEADVKNCRKKFENIFEWIDRHPEVTTVALAYFGNYFLKTAYAADHKINGRGPNNIKISSSENLSRYDTFKFGLKNSIERLIKLKKKVVILIDIPELPYFPRDCERQGISCSVPVDEVFARQAQHREMIASLKRDFPSILVFDPMPILCTSQACSYKSGATIMYRDSHHLTLNGSELYGKLFISWLNKQ
jgi:hypothetical protein